MTQYKIDNIIRYKERCPLPDEYGSYKYQQSHGIIKAIGAGTVVVKRLDIGCIPNYLHEINLDDIFEYYILDPTGLDTNE